MTTVSAEDYIKTIYALESRSEKATTSRIAREMGVTMGSVSGRIKSLARRGYLRHRPYYGVRLTGKGRRVAIRMVRRHRLIELFLVKSLNLSWDEVHADAEVLEHAVSDRLLERMYEYLGRPEFDPHGSPIPRADGSVRQMATTPLSALSVGASGEVRQVSGSDGPFLRYLSSLALAVGTRFQVVHRAPFGGPIELKTGRRRVVLGVEAADRILVRES